jgi:hypothetical protein
MKMNLSAGLLLSSIIIMVVKSAPYDESIANQKFKRAASIKMVNCGSVSAILKLVN